MTDTDRDLLRRFVDGAFDMYDLHHVQLAVKRLLDDDPDAELVSPPLPTSESIPARITSSVTASVYPIEEEE